MDCSVVWTIDIEGAADDMCAAMEALSMQRDPNSTATVFTICEPGKPARTVDLLTTNDARASSIGIYTVPSGTYAGMIVDGASMSVRLPNGSDRIAQDLLDIADVDHVRAVSAMRRAARLRSAAAYYAARQMTIRTRKV